MCLELVWTKAVLIFCHDALFSCGTTSSSGDKSLSPSTRKQVLAFTDSQFKHCLEIHQLVVFGKRGPCHVKCLASFGKLFPWKGRVATLHSSEFGDLLSSRSYRELFSGKVFKTLAEGGGVKISGKVKPVRIVHMFALKSGWPLLSFLAVKARPMRTSPDGFITKAFSLSPLGASPSSSSWSEHGKEHSVPSPWRYENTGGSACFWDKSCGDWSRHTSSREPLKASLLVLQPPSLSLYM